MTHIVTGLIARPDVLEAFSGKHSLHRPIALFRDLAILPLRDIDLEPFKPLRPEDCSLQYLSTRLVEELRSTSLLGQIMYFETEYFGGVGGQGAAVFQDGELVSGPQWADIGPINQALKLLGVKIGPLKIDEFDTIGLGRHRTTKAWFDLIEPRRT